MSHIKQPETVVDLAGHHAARRARALAAIPNGKTAARASGEDY
jgi:hypothetical protein